jgi:hypothetical protein
MVLKHSGIDRALPRSLTERLGVKASDVVILNVEADFNWFAAHFTVFDVGLATDGQV